MLVNRGDAAEEGRGSGYLVTSTTILTAAHVLKDAVSITVLLDVGQPQQIAVTLGEGSWLVDTEPLDGSAGAHPGTDLAVILIPQTETEGRQVPPAGFARLDRSADVIVGVVAYGFPRAKLRSVDWRAAPGLQVRDLDVVRADIPTTANRRQGTLALYLKDPPPRDEPEGAESPWAGFSGAAIWNDDRIVGVVSEHMGQKVRAG